MKVVGKLEELVMEIAMKSQHIALLNCLPSVSHRLSSALIFAVPLFLTVALLLTGCGGPMLDLQGKVIGVVTAKIVSIAVGNVGFAISANTVNTYLPQLEAG